MPQGYHKLAHLQAIYPDTAIFRRFGSLNTLVLLSLQAKLINLESDFEEFCKKDDCSDVAEEKKYSTNFKALHASKGSTTGSKDAQLQKLEEIQRIMNEYYDLLSRSAQIGQLSRPENHQLRFLDDWLWMQNDDNGFLVSQEARTWDEKYMEDLVSLFPPKSWLNPRIIDFYHRLRYGAKSKNPPAQREKDIELGPIQELDKLFFMRTTRHAWSLFITLLASLLPMVAILILYFVKQTLYRIAIGIGLTALVGLFLSLLTSAQTKEIFGATAA
jgi:hypothetical protein